MLPLMKLRILFTSVLFPVAISAQEALIRFKPYDGKVEFSLGEIPAIPSDRLTIRIDTLLLRFYPQPEVDLEMRTELDYYGNSTLTIDLDPPGSAITGKGTQRSDLDISKIDTSYSRKNMTGKRLLALGNVQLPPLQARKVEWLDINFMKGRVTSFDQFPKLRGFTQCNFYLYSDENQHQFQSRLGEFAHFRYPSDPFLWEDLAKCTELEALMLNSNNEADLFFLDEQFSKVLTNKKMRSVYLSGIPYLPVNFHDFGSLDYLRFTSVFLPEAINLAVVMNSCQKMAPDGNALIYLDYAKEKSITIPQNGPFITHYTNGQLLCKGSFNISQPDGKWVFYYDNGQLCEQRFYENGNKTGIWLFFTPDGDTLTKYRYENNRLVYREDRDKNYAHSCENYEFTYGVEGKVIYELNWKNDREVTISRKESSVVPVNSEDPRSPKGDTLYFAQEQWNFSSNEWEYSISQACGMETYEKYRKGNIGETAYYARNIEKSKRTSRESDKRYVYNQTRETIADMQQNIYSEMEFNDNNPEKILQKVRSLNVPLRK